MDFSVSSAYLTALFDIDKSTLTRWRKLGADAACQGRNQWDLKDFLDWWLRNIHQPADDNEPSLSAERLRYEKNRADKLEIEVCRLRETLLPEAEVSAALSELIVLAKRGFMILPQTVPIDLVGKDPAQMVGVLQRAIDEILTGLAEGATIDQVKKKIKSACSR